MTLVVALLFIPLLFAGVLLAWLSDRGKLEGAAGLITFLRGILTGS